jgi:DUF1365 family protein
MRDSQRLGAATPDRGWLTHWRLAFGDVIHTRLRPARHAFRYRAFFLRVPVHELDGTPKGSWLFGANRAALLSFREADHGDGGAALVWIRALLAQGGVQGADGEVWLHTFPRMFGYVFKPVSFWFCHDRAGHRRAIVAEVNNTFGERHFYLLSGDGTRPLRDGELLQAPKVFHVSPFCAVEGRYRFRFLDNGRRAVARVDHDDAHGPLLGTSMSGQFRAIDPRACARALIGYPWFTAGVVARIHWQALRLFLKRVPFWRKPAPPTAPFTHGSR